MRLIVVIAAAAALMILPAEAKQYPPRDECAVDASFAAFRTTLRGIVQRRDAKALLVIVSSTIEFDLGEKASRAGFVKNWTLDKPAASGVWRELDRALSRGCSLKDGEASAPYWYANGPDGDIADIALISGERVNLRDVPAKTGKVLRTVDWEPASVTDESQPDWIKVKLEDGAEGYVASDFVWTGYSYRALFHKIGGRWTMIAFVAGD